MNLTWQIAHQLSKPYLFIGGTPKKNPRTLWAKAILKIVIVLFRIHYKHNRQNGALFFIAKCFQSLGNFEKALDYFKKAWETDPFNPILCKEIGTCCLELERFEEGLKYALKEVSQFPSNPESRANLAYFLYKNNRFEEGKKVMQEAYNMDKNNSYVGNVFEIIEKNRKNREES